MSHQTQQRCEIEKVFECQGDNMFCRFCQLRRFSEKYRAQSGGDDAKFLTLLLIKTYNEHTSRWCYITSDYSCSFVFEVALATEGGGESCVFGFLIVALFEGKGNMFWQHSHALCAQQMHIYFKQWHSQ